MKYYYSMYGKQNYRLFQQVWNSFFKTKYTINQWLGSDL